MALFMAICMVMMARMTMHRVPGSRTGRSEPDRREAPERMLANRLASGEIDVDEYERLWMHSSGRPTRPGHKEACHVERPQDTSGVDSRPVA
jgi:hypothetical protein